LRIGGALPRGGATPRGLAALSARLRAAERALPWTTSRPASGGRVGWGQTTATRLGLGLGLGSRGGGRLRWGRCVRIAGTRWRRRRPRSGERSSLGRLRRARCAPPPASGRQRPCWCAVRSVLRLGSSRSSARNSRISHRRGSRSPRSPRSRSSSPRPRRPRRAPDDRRARAPRAGRGAGTRIAYARRRSSLGVEAVSCTSVDDKPVTRWISGLLSPKE
jgi:hypothetical protein